MTAQPKDDGHFRFEVRVGGEYRAFDFDTDAARITGSEALLIDQYAGDITQWVGRMEAKKPTGADIVLAAFLAARREQIVKNGTAVLDWAAFAEDVAPYTLRPQKADAAKSSSAPSA